MLVLFWGTCRSLKANITSKRQFCSGIKNKKWGKCWLFLENQNKTVNENSKLESITSIWTVLRIIKAEAFDIVSVNELWVCKTSTHDKTVAGSKESRPDWGPIPEIFIFAADLQKQGSAKHNSCWYIITAEISQKSTIAKSTDFHHRKWCDSLSQTALR